MRTAVLIREQTSDAGTFGQLILDDGWKCFTGELPWRGNMRGRSSVPAGSYICQWLPSPTHGPCYHLTNVPKRSEIEIHVANYCGDETVLNPKTNERYKCDLRGCIALGTSTGFLMEQMAVVGSRIAIDEFHRRMNKEPLHLIIHDIQEPAQDVTGERSM